MHKSDSSVQQLVETKIVRVLSKQLGIQLNPAKLALKNSNVRVDGYDPKRRVLCEVYAHVGATKEGQPAKIAKDLLKLVVIERHLGRRHRKILCFADELSARCVRGKSWLTEAAAELGVEVIVLKLRGSWTQKISAAQDLQIVVNA